MLNPLAQRRTELDLTQEQAAQRCGVTLSTWCNWEKFRTCPKVGTYLAICAGLEWGIDEVQDAVRQIERVILKRHAA